MDNWHVNARLTLQLGLRYDALPHAWERNNRITSFDPGQYQTALAPTPTDFTSAGAFKHGRAWTCEQSKATPST